MQDIARTGATGGEAVMDKRMTMTELLAYLWRRTGGGVTPFCELVQSIWDPATVRYPGHPSCEPPAHTAAWGRYSKQAVQERLL